jgi:hypothetical protein
MLLTYGIHSFELRILSLPTDSPGANWEASHSMHAKFGRGLSDLEAARI